MNCRLFRNLFLTKKTLGRFSLPNRRYEIQTD